MDLKFHLCQGSLEGAVVVGNKRVSMSGSFSISTASLMLPLVSAGTGCMSNPSSGHSVLIDSGQIQNICGLGIGEICSGRVFHMVWDKPSIFLQLVSQERLFSFSFL